MIFGYLMMHQPNKRELAALTQAVEYLLGKEEVGGSSPLGSSIFIFRKML